MGKKKTVKEVNGKLYARDEKGHYAGQVATGGKTVPVSGPIVPEDVTFGEEAIIDDPTTAAYAVYLENQARLYDDMYAKRLADVKRQYAYYSTNPNMVANAAHAEREITFIEERRDVEYTAVSEGTNIALRIKSIYTNDYVLVNLYGGAEERHDEVMMKYLAKNGAYWATVTEEDLARFRETDAQLLRDTARWGSD